MSESKIARVYATALYQAAKEEGRVEQVRSDLGEFVQAIDSSPELKQLLAAEEITDFKKTQVLMELTEGGDELMRNLLRVMVDKNRENETPGHLSGVCRTGGAGAGSGACRGSVGGAHTRGSAAGAQEQDRDFAE